MSKKKPPKRITRSLSPNSSRLRITRVYTRTGDGGTTRLVGGQVLKKNHPRIEAYGTVDELSVALGQARESLRTTPRSKTGRLRRLNDQLRYLQNLLFTLGGDLATRIEDRWAGMPLIGQSHIDYLEKLIDAYNASLSPLTDFVLPGGGAVSLALHACRVICRRAERRLQSLADAESVGLFVLPFLNRLSDLFFVLGRWTALGDEIIWAHDLPPPPIS